MHSSSLVPAERSDPAVYQRGHEPVQGRLPGRREAGLSRAASSQKCVRAGGKHNDLENVGFTRRHHTFFEMLGNFQLWRLLQARRDRVCVGVADLQEWFGIDPAKLYVTVFEGDASVPRDDEAEQFWLEVGVPKERIFGLGAKDNFWEMGDTGPCGPCSEIYYDLGVEAARRPAGQAVWSGRAALCGDLEPGVHAVRPRSDGTLTPLPKPWIDTGMGLERIACVLQGVLSNYETDVFPPLIGSGQRNKSNTLESTPDPHDADKGAASLRIIADHARAATFLISDGVAPADEGRGYVLRNILRRGIRHGRLLGQERPFMFVDGSSRCGMR